MNDIKGAVDPFQAADAAQALRRKPELLPSLMARTERPSTPARPVISVAAWPR